MRWLAGLVLVSAWACRGPTAPPGDGDGPPGFEIDPERFSADLATIAQPRQPGSAHWQAVQDLCAERFEALGFEVERHAYGTGVNVIGVLPGLLVPAERIVISAHYDGTLRCPGADDNASGVAGVLEAARVLAQGAHGRTLVVACWDEEEAGLVGSSAYVARARSSGEAIVASYVFEMIGYRSTEPDSQRTDPNLALVFPDQEAAIAANEYRGDFLLVVRDSASAETVASFEASAARHELRTITLPVPDTLKGSASGLRRSDHAPFWDAGYPAVMLTDTADFRNPHYHCGGGMDVVEDIDVAFAAATITATAEAVAIALDQP